VVLEGRRLAIAAVAAGAVLAGPWLADGVAADPAPSRDIGFVAAGDSGLESKLKPALQPTFHPPPPPY
jgi:hypothetical protein